MAEQQRMTPEGEPSVAPSVRSREAIKAAIERSLRREFPTDTVDVSDGYAQNIHVIVVSRRFDAMGDREAQDFLWDLAVDGLSEDERALLSLVVATSPALLK